MVIVLKFLSSISFITILGAGASIFSAIYVVVYNRKKEKDNKKEKLWEKVILPLKVLVMKAIEPVKRGELIEDEFALRNEFENISNEYCYRDLEPSIKTKVVELGNSLRDYAYQRPLGILAIRDNLPKYSNLKAQNNLDNSLDMMDIEIEGDNYIEADNIVVHHLFIGSKSGDLVRKQVWEPQGRAIFAVFNHLSPGKAFEEYNSLSETIGQCSEVRRARDARDKVLECADKLDKEIQEIYGNSSEPFL